VIHFPLNVKEGEGVELGKAFKVGIYYPLFVLVNSQGNTITRWTGYNGSSRFVARLNQALSDLTTVDERITDCDAQPTLAKALFLANYFTDSNEYQKAIAYYRRAVNLGGQRRLDYSFQIFKNCANAAWNDELALDSVFVAADAVIAVRPVKRENTHKMAQMMLRLTRKLDKLNHLPKYLQAGLDATAGIPDAKIAKDHMLLQADWALYVEHDTTRAITLKQRTMGPGGERLRDKFYMYSKWCLDRQIDLANAEMYARRTIDMVNEGVYRARVLSTAAQICDARGKIDDAIDLIESAIEQDPSSTHYEELLEGFQKSAAGR